MNNNNIFTISAYQREIKSEFGVLKIDNNNTLVGFEEKPIQKHDVSMGIYMVSKKVLDYIPQDTFYGFDHLMVDLIKDNQNPKIRIFNGYWLDIGRPDDYRQAIDEFEKLKYRFLK